MILKSLIQNRSKEPLLSYRTEKQQINIQREFHTTRFLISERALNLKKKNEYKNLHTYIDTWYASIRTRKFTKRVFLFGLHIYFDINCICVIYKINDRINNASMLLVVLFGLYKLFNCEMMKQFGGIRSILILRNRRKLSCPFWWIKKKNSRCIGM